MDYKSTLNLPKTDFPMKANLPQREPDLLAWWGQIGLYERIQQTGKGRPRYLLHDGPPYANGRIHIGHALNKILKDIIVKSKTMNPLWMAVLIIAGTFTMAGCVSDRKYQEALAETESAKTELATTRAQKSALEQQVKTLKDLNVKFGNEAQAARDELERIQYGRDKERGSTESRTKELEDRVKQLAGQNRSLRQEYEDTKRHNETLKSLVARYQKELKDQSRSPGGTLAPTMPPPPGGSAMSPPAPSAAKPSEGIPPAGGIMKSRLCSSSSVPLVRSSTFSHSFIE